MSNDSFSARDTLSAGGREHEIFRLDALQSKFDVARLPYSLKVLLENALRLEDGTSFSSADVESIASWDAGAEPSIEIPFQPARVLMQDFTGVPAVVDLAAMRDAMEELGGDPAAINPLVPVDLVIDHSVQVDAFGSPRAFEVNAERDYERNGERYAFLRWGQEAFDNFRVVPPATGICHQVNLEYLGRCVWTSPRMPPAGSSESAPEVIQAFPDTLVGTDSHTTMINGLGVLGWGVGGIEAEAAMLGQPISMLLPQVIGFKLDGTLAEGATATDLVLTVTEMLREHGVVAKFVEFFGPGLQNLRLADRATIGNMSPEFGSTCAIFPVDAETLRYLELTGRPTEQIELVDAYMREQGLFHTPDSADAKYTEVLELDLGEVEPSIAGPKRPQDRIALSEAKASFLGAMEDLAPGAERDAPIGNGRDEAIAESFPASDSPAEGHDSEAGKPRQAIAGVATAEPSSAAVTVELESGETVELDHGRIVIAAITSCTNTSNPSVMLAAGLLAKKAVEKGLGRAPWVKTSLAPGSKVVTDYILKAGLDTYLDQLQFNLVGYGCTTCIGNSGPLPEEISEAVSENELVVCSVLSGNRNFEGRINPDVRANYLCSPPLVVAYSLVGRMDLDITTEALGTGTDGEPVYLSDIWPDSEEIAAAVGQAVHTDMYREGYADVFSGDERWRQIEIPKDAKYTWPDSTYVRKPSFFEGMGPEPEPIEPINDARVLAMLGDSVTTDHISPAGAIKKDSPAGQWLIEHGVEPRDFNSYGSRRGNHEVMIRGTFANVRLRNKLADKEGGFTRSFAAAEGAGPEGEETTIYDAAMAYARSGTPLVVLAGKEYGSGSSRDWAAKGTALLGVRAVIAESYERIHRSNLIGMGVVPLQFSEGETAESLGLTGEEAISVSDLQDGKAKTVTVSASRPGADTGEGTGEISFEARVRLDTPNEVTYLRHGGILRRVLRDLRA